MEHVLTTHPSQLLSCPHCGMIQRPALAKGVPHCIRCHGKIESNMKPSQRQATLALSLAALAMYPAAITLPIMQVEALGHRSTTNIWQGCMALFDEGHLLVGFIVLLCSIIFPLSKLMLLLAILINGQRWPNKLKRHAHRAVEWSSRWGMLDVLLVAIMVSLLKLGDWMSVSAGPGLLAFTVFVVLSLWASLSFKPHWLWRDQH